MEIALGSKPATRCSAVDANSDGTVTINELTSAVSSALSSPQCELVILVVGSCARPERGRRDLVPCDDGTPVRAYSCEARDNDCVKGGSRQVLAESDVYGGQGQWGLAIPSGGTPAGTLLECEAEVDRGVLFRTLASPFPVGEQPIARATSAGLGDSVSQAIQISPVTEASVRLIEDNGLENFSNDEIAAVLAAVDQATADISFADVSGPAEAASLATQVAARDPVVIMVIESAVPTATPTATPTAPSTPTDTATETPTAPPVGRYVDNRDGTITDRQTGLIWEKKVGLGGGIGGCPSSC